MSTAHRWSSTVVAVAFGIIGATACSPDEPANEEFPTGPGGGVSQIAGPPPGWFGGSSRNDLYEVGRDVEVVHGGTTSAYLRSKTDQTAPSTFVSVTQQIRADDFRGKRIRYSGYLRTHNVLGFSPDGLALWLRGDGPRGYRAFDNMMTRTRVGTQDWTYAEIVVDIPEDVIGISFGALLAGPGMAWVDDLKIEVVTGVPATAPVVDVRSASYPDSASVVANYSRADFTPVNLDFEGLSYPESNAAAVEWMKSHSVSFLTDDPDAADTDLEPLRAMIGSSGLVALGESTHGTREFFRMKHRVFSWLVKNKGFTQFGIEASMPEALAVDYYVQTGIGDPATVVRGMGFWTWSTDEVVALVRWMRQWNASGGQPRVHFTGFDMQSPGVAMDSVQAFATTMSAPLGTGVQAAYACLAPFRNTPTRSAQTTAYAVLSQFDQDRCRDNLASVDSMFVNNMEAWSATVGAERVRLMQRLARLVSQWEDHARPAPRAGVGARDVYMAENVAFWRSRTNGTGTMLWAHNAHISRQAPWMGSGLASRYGGDYVNIAQTFSAGTFNAITQLQSGTFATLQTHGVSGSWPGSIEAMLDATGLTQVIFDARQTTGGGVPANSIRRQLSMRSIGSVFAPSASAGGYQARVLLPEDFDIVIWFRNAAASRLLSSAAVRELGFQVASP